MAFVSPPLSIPTSLGGHTGFDERPSSGGTGWGEPDPLAEEHDALLRNVLADHGITQADVDAGDDAVGICLDAASKAHSTLAEVSSFLSSLPQTSLTATAIAVLTNGAAGSGVALENSQAAEVAAAAAAQTKRKRPLSAGITASPDTLVVDNSATQNRLMATSGGSGASSLVTLAESSLEAAAAAAANNKGLKHFSVKVCEKVEGKGCTNYNEVADELVHDMLADAAMGINADGSQGNGGASGSGSGPHDDKNIRRRVYDALNVLEALGIIAKTKRDIEWRGWPPALRRMTTEKDRLEAERARLAARVKLKHEATQDVTIKAFCLSNLVLRNRDAPLGVLLSAQQLGMPAPNPLALPFMLVHAPENAEVDIDITPDERTARLNFHDYPFQIFDDERVMQMMGLGEPQPELAAALFGAIPCNDDDGNGDGDGIGQGQGVADQEKLNSIQNLDAAAAAAAAGAGALPAAAAGNDFLPLPEFQLHQVKREQDTEHIIHRGHPIDMSDTPLKVSGGGAVGGSADAALNFGAVGGFRLPDGSTAVLSPSAAVSAMDLGPDESTK